MKGGFWRGFWRGAFLATVGGFALFGWVVAIALIGMAVAEISGSAPLGICASLACLGALIVYLCAPRDKL